MNQVKMTGTTLETSALCLGTANYGTSMTKEAAFAQMDLFVQEGGNFLDTAHVYGDWACNMQGCSERVIGEWLLRRGRRSDILLSSKGCHPPIARMSESRVDVKSLREDVESSLKNLHTDYIDLYFFHRDNPLVPVAELMEAMEAEVKKGNILYYGCSNWSLARVVEASAYAGAHGLKGFSCNQMMFVLADVEEAALEKSQMTILSNDFYQYQKTSGLSLMAYMCMAGGYFSKRLSGRPVPEDQQILYGGDANEAMMRQMESLMAEGYQAADFMLRYVTRAAFPSIPIVSFSSEEQLKKGIRSIERNIPEEMMDALISLKSKQTCEQLR